MTQDEALREACRRWGDNAAVFAMSGGLKSVFRRDLRMNSKLRRMGEGYTWEAAFADAEKKGEMP